MTAPDDELRRWLTSDDPATVERAHTAALARMAGSPELRALAATAYDRLRAFAGRPQKFGTQAMLQSGEPVLWPVDPHTSDSERAKWHLPALARLEAMAPAALRIGKAPLRRLLRERRRRLAASAQLAAPIREHALGPLAALLTAAREDVLAGFWPLPDEADPRPLLHALRVRTGCTLALPVVVGDRLEFREWRDAPPASEGGADPALVPAGFGTLGPAPDARAVTPTVLLVPLVGFDRSRRRLGQGKGFYDRALAGLDGGRPFCCGVAFACQELPAVPTELHDRPIDAVVTELGWSAGAGTPGSTGAVG